MTITDLLPGFLLFVGFGLLHSIAARPEIKQWAEQMSTTLFRWYRLLYNLGALAYLLLFVWLIPGRSAVLYQVEGWLMLINGLFMLIGIIVVLYAFRGFDTSMFLGLRQIKNQNEALNEFAEQDEELNTDGLYAYIRHPLYLGSILIIWASPIMTAAWLQICIYTTLYFVIGSIHEEKLLSKRFGESYKEYKRTTKRLIPFLF